MLRGRMPEAVFFIKKKEKIPDGHAGPTGGEPSAEETRAVQAFRRAGLRSGILYGGGVSGTETDCLPAAEDARGMLLLCDSGELLQTLRREGRYVIGYSHPGNAGERFPGARYIVEEPDQVDLDSYRKMYEREAGIPWTILRTRRCLVREFTGEDLESIYGLYDAAACRFLEPPAEDREREGRVLRAYVERIYGLYGWGHWAVIVPGSGKGEPERLAGRIGYAALTAAQEREAIRLGAGGAFDADFGFLVGPQFRGKGIAFEVCSALLSYGFSELGFTRIRADARRENTASLHLLQKLGFSILGEGDDGRLVFLCEGKL